MAHAAETTTPTPQDQAPEARLPAHTAPLPPAEPAPPAEHPTSLSAPTPLSSPASPPAEPASHPLKRLVPSCLTTLSTALLKATALELAILAGHLLLYPTGITQERPSPAPDAPATPDDEAPRLPATPRPPVVLLHGFIDNRSVFVLLRRALAQHGTRPLTSLNYSPLTCDIRTAAELLARHIEDVCERTGSRQVDVVGHSLGGLIARYYVQRLGGDTRVRTLVTLGTPHGGTRAVPLANAHPIVRQMRPGSPVMAELERPAPGCRTRFVSFWSDMDQVMDPPETACVDHPDLRAENVRVTGIGHLALPVHPAVAAGIREALDTDLPKDLPNQASGTRQTGLTVA